MDERVLLVTGFGPFPGVERNPSGAAAQALDGLRLAGWRVAGRTLDTSWARAFAQLRAHVEEMAPEMLVMLGVAPRAAVEIERLAHNRCVVREDVDGCLPPADAVAPAGPAVLETTLPLLPDVGVSEDAGSYLCNYVFYRARHELPVPRCGFVHLPPDGEAAACAVVARLAAAASPTS